jgi:chromate transporter
MPSYPRSITLSSLAVIFCKAGCLSFGGWSSTALIFEHELIEIRKLISKAQLQEAVTYAQVLPGATQISIVSNLGYAIAGVQGSVVATIAYLIPVIALITGFAALYFGVLSHQQNHTSLVGVYSGLAGLVGGNAFTIARKQVGAWWGWLFIVAAIVLRTIWQVHPAIVILLLGASGTLLLAHFDPSHKKS